LIEETLNVSTEQDVTKRFGSYFQSDVVFGKNDSCLC
jgi:hypothetical protein